MDWARIMVPLTGRAEDEALLAAGHVLAAPFGAELAGVYAPADIADLVPWMSDGMIGGVEVAAIDAVKEAAVEGERASRRHLEASPAARKSFTALISPVMPKLDQEARLSDVVVLDQASACGKTRLGQAFQDLLAGEQRPIVVTKGPLPAPRTVLVAWNGGKEASRAARTALPLLQRAERVLVITADEPRTRDIDPARMADFLAARGVAAEPRRCEKGEAAQTILTHAADIGADLIVSGAFGHARLREYVLGGATRGLLNASGPALFLSH
ncbi:MAG: universal stress protein UspA [Caulobacteraceae bacterium]|nr:universal stress protein UspA [Caulobacteraceae bacterium]